MDQPDPAIKIKVEIQQTDGHAALNIPPERLEAIAHEVSETGIQEWGVDDASPRTVILEYKWGDIDTNIIVRRLSAVEFQVVFMTKGEFKRQSGS